jgi:DNA-binding transcriptional regulator YbjK
MVIIGENLSMQEQRISYGSGRMAIADAVISFVAREGLSKLTHRSLAAEAQVSHGSVRYHFKTVNAAIEAGLQRAYESSGGIWDRPNSLRAVLEGVAVSTDDVTAFLMEVILESRRQPALRGVVSRLYEGYRTQTREALNQVGLPSDDDFVDLLLAFSDGVAYQVTAVGPSQVPVAQRQVRRLFDLLQLQSSADATD